MSDWYCKLPEGTSGPFSFEELTFLKDRGKLLPDHLVRQGEHGPWIAASSVGSLFGATPDRSVYVARAADRSLHEGTKRTSQEVPKGASPKHTDPNQPSGDTTHEDNLLDQQIIPSATPVTKSPPSLPVSSERNIKRSALIGTCIGAGFVFVYLMNKKRLQPVSDKGGDSLHKQRLLAKLSELDDDFADGRIPEETYRKLRAEKKAELIELMQRQNGE